MSSLPPFGRHWPEPPAGPALSVLDVGLLDLARHAVMRAGISCGTNEADADTLWRVLRSRADDLGPDLGRDDVLAALEPGAHEWAKARAAEHNSALRRN